MSDKLINTFHLRRKLNADIEALGETSSEHELTEQVRSIIHKYDSDLILAGLRRFLNTSSSQLRGGLGRLAALLPYESTVSALRQEAANRNNPTQTRLTAALILERFLQAEVPAALMSDLKDPETVVMQSLQEAIEEGRQNHYVLLEYVRQMRQENADVAYMVLDLLQRVPAEDRPELLRLIAYDTRVDVAKTALDQLATLRQEPVAEQAAEALHTLQLNLAPELRRHAERSLRKLRFRGVTYEPPPMKAWRALLSPCTMSGIQDLWFLRHVDHSSGILIGLRLNVHSGLLETFGSEEVDPQYLPPRRNVGEMISIAMSSGAPSVFLEVPVDYARWHLLQVIDTHWQQTSPPPLPDEYTLYNAHIFRYQTPELDSTLAALLTSGPDLWDDNAQSLVEVAAELLHHPAMASWFFQNRRMTEALQRTSQMEEPVQLTQVVDRLIAEMFDGEHANELSETLRASLLAQAAWLALAGHERAASQAVLIAESMDHVPLADHPLAALMVEVGMMLLLNRRAVR